MAFTPINDTEIEVGKPLKQGLFQKIKDSLDDHEDRIESINAAVSGSRPLELDLLGEYATLSTQERDKVVKLAVSGDITITKVTLLVDKAGVSGTTDIDIQHAVPTGIYSSVLESPLSIPFGAGNEAEAVGSLNSNVDVDNGSIITLTLINAQSEAENLYVRIEFNYRQGQ